MKQDIEDIRDSVQIGGVVVPILTPLNTDESVDVASLRRLVNYVIDRGVHGIWAAGTTGEFAALDDKSRRLVIETVVSETAGRVPIIGNISAAATKNSIAAAASLSDCSLFGIAATPPYYYSYTQDELIDHYHAIADISCHPLWIYNIPSTVQLTMEPDTIATLVADGTVVGIKDSSGSGEAFAQLVMLCQKRNLQLYRFVGSTWRITMNGLGIHGVIPGIANLVPDYISKAWEAGQRGDGVTSERFHDYVLAGTRMMRLGAGNTGSRFSGLKHALKLMGIIENDTVSSPFQTLGDEEKAKIPSLLEQIGFIT